MNIDIKEFYDTYLKQLGWREKLELIELLMQATLESVREEKEPLPSAQKTEEQLPDTSKNESHTDLQKKLLDGPVMAEEDYLLYKEKKQHFAQWK